jgi:large subunit ribosomal protein L9
MKVILMQKVERLGDPGQQVDVADGYARNFLLPKQLAVPATAGRMKSLTQLTAQAKNREEREKREAQSLADRLASVEVTLHRRASEETPAPAPVVAALEGAAQPAETPAEPGPSRQEAPEATVALLGPRLFGSVTSHDVADALAGHGFTVDRKKILLPEPIKTLGVHRVPIRLHADVTAEVTVKVEREA